MEKIDFNFAEHAKSLRAVERKAELMRAQFIAETVASAWNRIASLFRTNKAPAQTTA